jgi:Protein of unknown function (DUF1579)
MKHRFFFTAIALVALSAFALRAEDKPKGPPQPGPEHKRLAYFEGKWTSEGEMKESPFGPAGKVTGTDVCEFFPGGFFLKCTGEGKTPMGDMKNLGILGYSADDKVYTYYGIDNMGMGESSKGSLKGDTWTFTSSSKMNGKVIKGRYVMKEISPTSYSFSWSTADDKGGWTTVMEGKETRAK